ncbi:MAG: hypothetical protein Crog4KO_08890 [Crocinitomicaceae bacterium]
MSGKVNEALYDLVQSMSKSEKRYFKLMSSRHTIGSENNYVRIFDYLDKLPSYDEKALFDYFKGEAFLKRFSITKKRLYDHILSALDAFHASSSIEAQIHKMLHASDILYDRSLYDQSRRLLRSAEKLALKHEKPALVIEIGNKQKRILETTGYSGISQAQMNDFTEQENTQIESLQYYATLWKIKSRLFGLLSKKGVARSKEDAALYKEICQEIIDRAEPSVEVATEARYLYYHVISAYYYATANLDKSLEALHKNLELMEQSTGPSAIEVNKQVSVLTNAIYISDKLGDYKSSISYLNQLKTVANKVSANEDLEIKLFSSINSIELSMNLRKGDFTNAARIADDVKEKLDQFGTKVVPARRAFLEFKVAVAYIGIGDFSQALKWVNRILNDGELDQTEDIISFTQLLELLIHLELHHDQLLPYSIKSTQRFLKTRNRLYSFEKVFLQFIGKLSKCDDRFEVDRYWGDLYNELATLTDDDAFESVALDYFDFQSWAEAKLKGKDFESVVREKYNRTVRQAS